MRSQIKRGRIASEPRTGVVAVLCCVAIVVLIVFAAFIVDFGWMGLTRCELRAASDASARGALMSFVADDSVAGVQERISNAREVAKEIFHANQVGGVSLTLDDQAIEFGTRTNGVFKLGGDAPNAVRVHTDTSTQGGVPLFLAGLFGVDHFSPRVSVTTAFDPVDVVALIDISRSMAYSVTANRAPAGTRIENPPQPGSRFIALEAALAKFLAAVKERSPVTRIGLVTLGGGQYYRVVTPYDDIYAKIETDFNYAGIAEKEIMDRVYNIGDSTLPYGTSHYGGFEETLRLLQQKSNQDTKRMVVMLSDGWQSGKENRDPNIMARAIAAEGVDIHTIYFAGQPSGVAPMREYAAIGNGMALVASDEDQLDAAFRVITDLFQVSIVE